MARSEPSPSPFTIAVSPWAAITVLMLLAWADALWGSNKALGATALVICSLIFHEIGHVVAARINHVPVSGAGCSLMGTYIRRKRAGSAKAEFMISLAGPLASLLLAGGFSMAAGPMAAWLAQVNLIVALSNLIPLWGTDGDHALNAICFSAAASTAEST